MTQPVAPADLPVDPLLSLVDSDTQRQAARLVQEAFVAAFRLSLEGGAEQQAPVLAKLAEHLEEWCGMATRDAAILRRALLLSGLDQWGLAFMQAFGPGGLNGLAEIVGALRDGMDIADEAECQKHFAAVREDEAAALEFKIALRRELHLALWHAMIAAETQEESTRIVQHLGGMLIALMRDMPTVGWRLVADALASIQIRCLAHGLAVEGLAQESTQALFAALYAEMGDALRSAVMEQSSQVVMAWQQARRAAAN